MLLSAACQSAPQPTAQVAAPAQSAAEATALSPEGDAAPPTVAPVAQEPVPPVEVRKALAATDPATVNLANGTPTLVEFFAFW
jgi:hypothetical protein